MANKHSNVKRRGAERYKVKDKTVEKALQKEEHKPTVVRHEKKSLKERLEFD